MITLIILSIFTNAKTWIVTTATAGVAGLLFAFLKKKGWTLKIDYFAKLTAKFSRKLSVILMRGASTADEVAEVAETLDAAIDDTTGEFDKKQTDEIIKEAKDVVDGVKNVIEGVKS